MLGEENNVSKKLWLSVSQAAKLFGVEQKTIRRVIKAKQVNYVVENNRYSIDMGSLVQWAHQNIRVKNKMDKEGIGKFVKEWREEFKNS